MKRLLSILLVVLCLIPAIAQTTEPLFKDKALNRSSLPALIQEKLSNLEKNPAYKSVRYVETTKDFKKVQKEGKLNFTVPGVAKEFAYRAKRVKFKNDNDFVWYGNSENGLNDVLIMAKDGKLFGMFKGDKGEVFEFYTLDDNIQVVMELDMSRKGSCGAVKQNADHIKKMMDKSATARQATCSEPTRILILYNIRVQYSVPNYQQEAYLGVEIFNQIATNSQMNGTPSNLLELVGFEFNNFNEAQSATWHYSDWARVSQMPSVQSLQSAHKADIVIQLVQGGEWLGSNWNDSAYDNPSYSWFGNPSPRGLAAIAPGDQSGSAAIVRASAAGGSAVLAHEVGHIFGGEHQDGGSLAPYAKAYRFEAGNEWRQEIMYSGGGSILHFGNPNVSFLGEPTGVANQYDNARRMSEVSPSIRDFQPPANTPTAYIDGNLFPPYTGYYQYEAVHMCYAASSFQWWVSNDGFNYNLVSNDESFYLFIPPYEQNLYLKLTITYAGGLEATTFQTIYAPACPYCRKATEQSTDNELVIFPNPVSETAMLKFSLSEKSEVSRLIANMQGQIVQKVVYGTLQPGTHEQTVDVRAMPPGTYIVNVRVGQKSLRQELIVTH